MPVGLRPGVSFCEASGHLVFLDIEADRYFGLSANAETAFRRLLEGRPQTSRALSGDIFLESGLLVDEPDAFPVTPCGDITVARASLLDQPLPRVCLLATLRALIGLSAARLTLRVGGLARALRAVTARKARLAARPAHPATLESQAAAFHRCALLVRSHDQCLARSLALVRALAAHGEAADLVIGVRVRPFSAHAWVQKDDLLLNESCDAVRGYTPILVL
jgi:hypothetical protein